MRPNQSKRIALKLTKKNLSLLFLTIILYNTKVMNKTIDSITSKNNNSPKISSSQILDSKTKPPKNNISATDKNSQTQTEPYQINLLNIKNSKKPKKKKFIILLLLVVMVLVAYLGITKANNLTKKIFTGQTTTIFGKVWEALRGATGKIKLIGENNGQINILLLGIGGAGHEGPYLTDTMLLAQIKPETLEITLISIPRDWLTVLPRNLGERKINSVFAEGFALTKNWDEAGKWARQAVERMSGQTIPYFAVVDFQGFEKAIDEVGGLDITIDHTFTDAEFPNEKFGYLPAQTFTKGQEHMDGKRALIYVRSRHGNNNEGSDFARSVRQQKVIKTFKDSVLSKKLITSPGRINKLLEIVANHFHTNLNPGELFKLHEIVNGHNIQTFSSLNLGLETGLVCSSIQENTKAYILIPCADKDEADIRNYFKNAFLNGKLLQEKSRVWLADSAHKSENYRLAEKKLIENGFKVWQLNYDKDYLSKNIVFVVNPKPASLEFITKSFSAQPVSLPPPGVKVDPEKVDIILILGE